MRAVEDPKHPFRRALHAERDPGEAPLQQAVEHGVIDTVGVRLRGGLGIGSEAEQKALALKAGEVLLLENLRFYPQEEKPELDPSFAEKLAKLGDLYVNDAFGTAHRAHASTEGIAHYLPAVAGFLIEKEISFLGGALDNPKRPFVGVLGGAKVKDKIDIICGESHTWTGLNPNQFATYFLDRGFTFKWMNATEASTFVAERKK